MRVLVHKSVVVAMSPDIPICTHSMVCSFDYAASSMCLSAWQNT